MCVASTCCARCVTTTHSNQKLKHMLNSVSSVSINSSPSPVCVCVCASALIVHIIYHITRYKGADKQNFIVWGFACWTLNYTGAAECHAAVQFLGLFYGKLDEYDEMLFVKLSCCSPSCPQEGSNQQQPVKKRAVLRSLLRSLTGAPPETTQSSVFRSHRWLAGNGE